MFEMSLKVAQGHQQRLSQ